MTYLPTHHEQWQVLDVALALHMSKTGASDPMQGDEGEAIEFLTKRIREWKPAPTFTEQFDNAVKAVLVAALAERGVTP